MMTRSRHKVIGLLAAVAAVSLLLASVDPMGPAGRFLPKCPLKWLTGYDCPGCGSTRAIHSLLSGNPVETLRFNYFLPVASLALAGALAVEVAPCRLGRLRRAVYSPVAAYSFAALCVAWWITRNLLNV